ncbi:MAG: PAS domain S-box protein [Snowella sp.]|nr:PAS domain S-box protein [Snowella sp.]
MESDNPSLAELDVLTTSPKILIVDDSESDRFSYVRYLQSDQENSYRIIEAETLEEGLELWRSQQPNIVLLDINLPDGDGLEFLEAIGTDQPINKLPVIMLTGQGDERIAVQAMKLGAADYLVKGDVTAVSLLTCIGQVQENNLLLRQLRRSQNQQTIIASIALHIRQSLNFEEVANRTVQEIRRFLEADRMLIYRFNPDMSGVIIAEAIVPPWQPYLNTQVEDNCFAENMRGEYQQGKIFAVADIYAANLTECHIKLLERFQVRANLVVPILVNGNNNENNTLWGLLIANQCSGPRQWLAEDIQLLHQLSVHLSLALQQAELYQNLENLNASLEQRTQALQLQNKVLEEIHDAVVTTNLHGIILSWNHGAEKLYGYTEAEVLGRNISFMYDNAEALQTEVIVPLLESDRHTTEIVVLSKSGKRIDISLRLSVVKDQEGNINYLMGFSNDISDRKRAEQELQQLNQALEDRVIERTAELTISERKYSTLASTSPVAIFYFDAPLNCVYVNERWSQLTGRSAESAMGRGWLEAIHPDDRDLILNSSESQFYSPLSKINIFSGEGRHLCPDGSVNWVYFQVAKEFNEAGEIVGYIGTLTDISDRKQTESALIESEAKFRRLVEDTNDLTWSQDAEGVFTYLSPQFQRFFGFDPKDWIGKTFSDLVHPDDLDWMMSGYRQYRQAAQRISNLEFRHLHQNGHYIWVSINITPIMSAEGRFMGSQGILTDISDRKLAEAQLQQKNIELEELVKLREEALTLREDMSNMLIHDLRNPLSAILLSAGIIKQYGYYPHQKALLIKKAEQILTAGKRLKNMIDSLLLMAKLESSKILFNPAPTDLQELGNSIITDFELTANAQTIELKGELPNPGNSIVIDAVILRRVIENLISNALKFSPPHSQVWLKIEYLSENHLRVQVSDNGPGVSPDQAEDIFKKFEIGTVKANISQIGLGLAFCKMAVEAQGGTLAIAPNQPQGSIFTVEI